MAYITQQDLEDELGEAKLIQLTDDNDSGVVGEKRIERAIGYAVGTFESYARARYTLPVPVTEKVRAACIDLAVFHLFKSRASTNEGVYKVRKDAHDSVIRWLSDIQAGKAGLDVPAVEETLTKPASPDEVLRGSDQSAIIFSDDKLSGY